MDRRCFLALAPAAALLPKSVAAAPSGLSTLTRDAKPIGETERLTRIARLQKLMVDAGVGATIMESGSSLDYFTGVQWRRSERTTAAMIPARGGVVIVTPAFEEPSVRETLAVPADVRPWNEHESPFERLTQALHDRGVASGPVGFEWTTRLFIVDGVLKANPALAKAPGNDLVQVCRLIKSPAELALMQAVGFERSALQRLVLVEHSALLVLGLLVGTVAALVAVLPALVTPGAGVPWASLSLTLLGVLLNGALWTWLATRRALRGLLVDSLRAI